MLLAVESSGTKIDTRGSGPTSRVPWPWPAPDSVNAAARPGAWCHGFERFGSNRRTVMPLPGISSAVSD